MWWESKHSVRVNFAYALPKYQASSRTFLLPGDVLTVRAGTTLEAYLISRPTSSSVLPQTSSQHTTTQFRLTLSHRTEVIMSTTEATPPTTILSIPAELQTEIATYLRDEDDIFAFRQACRELCAASHDTFVDRFFTRRTYLYCKHGIQQLLDLSTQSHLISKLQQIELVSFSTERDSWSLPERSIGDKISNIAIQHTIEDNLKLAKAPVVTTLAQMLNNLSQANASPCFSFPGLNEFEVPDGLAKLPGLPDLPDLEDKLYDHVVVFEPSESDPRVSANNHALLSLSKASALSTARLTALDLHYAHIVRLHELSDVECATAWSCLKSLSFKVTCLGFSDEQIIQMSRLITAAHQLHTLDITLRGFSDPLKQIALLEMLDGAAAGHQLRSISITGSSNYTTQHPLLLRFLLNHRKTLRELRLSDTTVSASSILYELAEFLSASFHLETVVFSGVQVLSVGSLCMITDDNGCTVFEFCDKETNSVRLAQLRNTCQITEVEDEYDSDEFGSEGYDSFYEDYLSGDELECEGGSDLDGEGDGDDDDDDDDDQELHVDAEHE